MLLRTLLTPEDYRSHFGVGLLSLGIGALLAIIGTSRLVSLIVQNTRWVDFLDGLFTGVAIGMIVFSLVVTARGIVFLRRTGTD